MKLKKIASLALAGVMAVSMLAGCATKAPTAGEETTTTSDLSTAVAKAVSEDTAKLVTFTKGTDLEKAVAAYRVEYGSDALVDTNGKAQGLKNYVAGLPEESSLTGLSNFYDSDSDKVLDEKGSSSGVAITKEDLDKALTGSAIYVVGEGNEAKKISKSEELAVKDLAAELDKKVEALNKANKLLSTALVEVEENGTTATYRVNLKFTGEVYAYTAVNANGLNDYGVVFTVSYTGTATKVG